MDTKFLTPNQKMIILEGLKNNRDYFEDVLLSELDRLENTIRDCEMVLHLANDKLNSARYRHPVDIHSLRENNKST